MQGSGTQTSSRSPAATDPSSQAPDTRPLCPALQLSLSFGVKAPGSNSDLTLDGIDAWDAAVYCASISAGKRGLREKAGSSASVAASSEGAGSSSAQGERGSPRSVLQRLASRLLQGSQ